MLGTLLEGRLVFTPRPEVKAVECTGRRDFDRLFAGLIDVFKGRQETDEYQQGPEARFHPDDQPVADARTVSGFCCLTERASSRRPRL